MVAHLVVLHILEVERSRGESVAASPGHQLQGELPNALPDPSQVGLCWREEDDRRVRHRHRRRRVHRLHQELLHAGPLVASAVENLKLGFHVIGQLVLAHHDHLAPTQRTTPSWPSVVHVHAADLLAAVVHHRLRRD